MTKTNYTYGIIFLLVCNVFISQAADYSPWAQSGHGPLYEGVKMLLADEEVHAQVMRNDAQQQLEQTLQELQDTLSRIEKYESTIEQHLQVLNTFMSKAEYKRCYKQHISDIAHFNRELLNKSHVCKRALGMGIDKLYNRTAELMESIGNATEVVHKLAITCKIGALKYDNSNQEGVTLCIVASIGLLDQRLLDASQFFLDIIAEVALNHEGDGDAADGRDNCREFEQLKQEFDVVYEKINKCITTAKAT